MVLVPAFCLFCINLSRVVSCGGNYTDNDVDDANYFLDDDLVFDADRFIGVIDGDNCLFFSA